MKLWLLVLQEKTIMDEQKKTRSKLVDLLNGVHNVYTEALFDLVDL